MKKITCIVIGLFTANIVISQNAEQDFAKINSTLMTPENIVIETEYKVYPSHYSQTPIEVSFGCTKQKGNKIYQRIATVTSLMNEKISVFADTADRILLVADPVKVEDQKKKAMNIDLKNTFSKCSSIRYKEAAKDEGIYYLEFKQNVVTEYSRCDIHFDRKKFLVTKIIYYYNEPMALKEDSPKEKETPRLEIVFKKIDLDPKLSDKEFDEKRFIHRNGNKIQAAAGFRNYKITDNRYYTRSK